MSEQYGSSADPSEGGPDDRLFRALFEAALDAILIADDARVYVDANPAACQLFGLAREALVGQRLDDFVSEAARDGLDAMWRTFLEHGELRGEYRLVLPDGSVRDCDFRARASILPGRHLSILRDVTARKRAETSLAGIAPRFRDMFGAGAGFKAVISPEGEILDVNAIALEAGGLSRDDVIGRPVWDAGWHAHSDETRDTLRADVARAKGGEIVRRESEYRTADGALRVSDRTLSPVRDETGDVVCILMSGLDVTERRRAEDRLRSEATTLEAINRISALIAGEMDLATIVQTITEETTALAGAAFGAFFYNLTDERGESYTLYTLAGVPRDSFSGFPMPRNTKVFGPTFAGEGVVRLADVTRDARYGQNPPYRGMPPGHLPVRSYLAVPVVSRSGEVLGGLFYGHPEPGVFGERDERAVVGIAAQAAIAMDNANLFEAMRRERAEAEVSRRAAEDANRAKDEFLAVVSHELRTPLNAMLGWTRMLRAGDLDAPTTAHALEVVERNTIAQVQLIEDLLDVSRIVTGKLRIELVSVDLVAVVEAAADAARPAADAKGIALTVVIDPEMRPVAGDAERLQQVVWNLLSNAVKFTPKGGRVTVALRHEGSNVELTVADTGVGIAPAFLPYVFDRFRQADGGTTRQYGGLGLGLAIVRSIMELHGGTVRVASGGERAGATFTVSLPLPAVSATREPDAEVAAVPAPVSLDGVRVLVVEDEADSRDLMRAVLEAYGAEVRAAGTASAAIAALDAEVPHVLVSDIGLPGEDGYALVERVRARAPEAGGRVLAIALTAYARDEDRERALAAGFDAHLPKPVDPAGLAAAVAAVLGGRATEPGA